jgi:hypothetical protein
MSDRVECHSGHTYAQRPTALWWEGARLEVAAVTAEWRTPEGKCFRVRTSDGRMFEVEYSESQDRWSILPIKSPVSDP